MLDVQARWEQLRDATPALRLYALIDGVQYQTHFCKRLRAATGLFPLFAGTRDAALAHAGPWLADTHLIEQELFAEVAQLERDGPSVSWLIAPQDLDGLGQLLQLRLDVHLPDGRAALLRFWDPRVLLNLAQTLGDRQRAAFFGHIVEWHLLHEGRRCRIGKYYADAHG